MIYFDNGASTYPKPKNVTSAVSKFIANNGANPGRSSHKPAMQAANTVYNTREIVADFLGVSNPENIAFVPNATYGLNMLIQGLISDGDEIVITDLEHNSIIRPVHNLSLIKNVKYKIAPVDFFSDEKTISNILDCINNNTKLVICTQCSNTCGRIMPIYQLSKALPEHVKLVVDGSQGAGTIKIDLQKFGVDYYCAPSHKGLMGIQGGGIIAVNSSTLPAPVIFGGTGSDSLNFMHPDYMPDIFECGTVPTPVILSIAKGIEFINLIGIDNVFSHKLKLTKYADKKLKQLKNVITYTDCNTDLFCSTICFNVKDISCFKVAQWLSDNDICVRSGIHCAPLFHKKIGTEKIGAVRISFGIFNTEYEIDKFIKILNKIL